MLRKSDLTGELIFFAEERANRPHLHGENDASRCPFCLANESMKPPNLYETDDKRIRIFPNLYPILGEGEGDAYGIHTVLVDTDQHKERLHQFSDANVYQVLFALKKHTARLLRDEQIRYVQIFKNDGINAGASQAHSHWQIAALSVMPPRISLMMQNLSAHYEANGTCYFCDMEFGARLIEENELFYGFAPRDSKFCYEINIVPKQHVHGITGLSEAQLWSLGTMLKSMLNRLNNVSHVDGGIPYNICVYSAPDTGVCNDAFHFYVQIIPRMGNMAGFEFSTGCYINSVLPETAAENLRSV